MMNGAARYVGPTVPIEVTVGADTDGGITLSIIDGLNEGLEATLTPEQAASLGRHLLSLSEPQSATALITPQNDV